MNAPAVGPKKLGVAYGGSLPEHRVIEDPRFAPWFASTVYLPELTDESLADLDGPYVPEGSNHRRLQAVSGPVGRFLDRGGTVLMFSPGSRSETRQLPIVIPTQEGSQGL
jgi:hypothetical protein